jgi:hypothetical protein
MSVEAHPEVAQSILQANPRLSLHRLKGLLPVGLYVERMAPRLAPPVEDPTDGERDDRPGEVDVQARKPATRAILGRRGPAPVH